RVITVGRREERGALNVRVVIWAARRNADEFNLQLVKQIEELKRLGQIDLQRVFSVAAEGVRVTALMALWNSAPIIAHLKRQKIDGARPPADHQARRVAAHACHKLAQKPRAVFQCAAVTAFARGRAQKLVTQVTVAVFQVNESVSGGLGS